MPHPEDPHPVAGYRVIVSHAHNYLFVKTVKVAGTSVELALSRHCGPADIITPVHPSDEGMRPPGARPPQNYSPNPELEREYAAAISRGKARRMWKLYRELREVATYYNHMPAREIRPAIGAAFWEGAFKFTIDRNPYDRVVSGAFWMAHVRGLPTDPDTIGELVDLSIRMNYRNVDLYSIDGRIAVDRVLRYEHLAEDLASIADRIGGDISTSLPRTKVSASRAGRPATEILTAAQKRRITERYADVFDVLGYPRES